MARRFRRAGQRKVRMKAAAFSSLRHCASNELRERDLQRQCRTASQPIPDSSGVSTPPVDDDNGAFGTAICR